MQPSDDNPEKNKPSELVPQGHPQNKKLVIIIALCAIATIALVSIVIFILMSLSRNDPTTAQPQITKNAELGTAKCPMVKAEYEEVAKQVYLPKDDYALKSSDATVQHDAEMISKYLSVNYPNLNFVLMSSYSIPSDNQDGTTYRSYEIANGAVVELGGLVPQITVNAASVEIELNDGYANLMTQAQRNAIATTEVLNEAELSETLNKIVDRLNKDEKTKLYGAFNDNDGCIKSTYELIWSKEHNGLMYRASLNSSRVELDASTGKVLLAEWHDGIIN